MMFIYHSSLINYKYKDTNIKSFRHLSFFLCIAIIYINYSLLSNAKFYERFVGLVLVTLCLIMHLSARLNILTAEKEYEKLKHNEYINNLLAENERNRIGRDLHDTLGHVFATLSLKSDLAIKFLEREKYLEAKQEIAEFNSITKDTSKQIRQIINNLNYRTLEEELYLTKEILDLANIRFEIHENFAKGNLSPIEQSTLAMVLRECINNILKHSEATFCKITFQEDVKELAFYIEDNGKGFGNLTGKELKSIKERIILVDGKVAIENIKNPTQIKITIPKGVTK
ncbi:sensor histidine kinase [Gemella sp. zg-570]|uniref:sensor histidine kinase n=1 Tax=Gemella sp. zg-570 TaxID=2840371 RepID=UPI001C0D05C8|nr:histidine kinase [Gemella sp. zg-570]QWQ38877.1 sensor histidine kinase [Gemella sp. zg-570]